MKHTGSESSIQNTKIIDNLEDISKQGIEKCILLYSGGIDGSFFLNWAMKHGIEVTALHVGLLAKNQNLHAENNAKKFGARFVFKDMTEEFLNNYVSRGILANAYYHGRFPISASLSRPLIAKAAIDLAHSEGSDQIAIAHTSTDQQNSASRFTLSIMALDPNIIVLAPFLNSHLGREEKGKVLADMNIIYDTGINSVDENIWLRDIESGHLENPEHDLPQTGIFHWTKDIEQTPDKPEILDIKFENGLPFQLNGQDHSLIEIVNKLNEIGGDHGVGRFHGMEDNALYGSKNFEVKEAPAAHIIMSSHMELESVIFREGGILSDHEYSLKRYIDDSWTTRVVFGHWYSDVTDALFLSIARLNELIEGTVRVKLFKGHVIIMSRKSANGIYYSRIKDSLLPITNGFPFPRMYEFMRFSFSRHRSHRNLDGR